MKKVLLIATLFLCILPLATFAQIKSDLRGAIVKETAKEIEQPLGIQDMRYQSSAEAPGTGLFSKVRNQPGLAWLSSAILPGSGQAINGNWVRAGIFFGTEVLTLIYHLDRNNTAKRQEEQYINYANQNWSVLAYAQWVVDYSKIHNLNNGFEDLETNITGKTPDFNTSDWQKVNLGVLHSVERETAYIFPERRSSNFSHTLPSYGSQQYYELISKYYQFQSGWSDFSPGNYFYMWDGTDSSPQFFQGRDRAATFNDNYRLASNILNLMLVNHVISAFDSYFTVKLKNSRIQASANLLRPDSYSLTFHF